MPLVISSIIPTYPHLPMHSQISTLLFSLQTSSVRFLLLTPHTLLTATTKSTTIYVILLQHVRQYTLHSRIMYIYPQYTITTCTSIHIILSRHLQQYTLYYHNMYMYTHYTTTYYRPTYVLVMLQHVHKVSKYILST